VLQVRKESGLFSFFFWIFFSRNLVNSKTQKTLYSLQFGKKKKKNIRQFRQGKKNTTLGPRACSVFLKGICDVAKVVIIQKMI
jgi:hypothetical protein